MKIYKIRGWVNRKSTKRNPHPDRAFSYEEVVLNLETAKRKFEFTKREVNSFAGMSGYSSGYAQLFIPHIFEDGTLAYWPADEKYIEKYEWPE